MDCWESGDYSAEALREALEPHAERLHNMADKCSWRQAADTAAKDWFPCTSQTEEQRRFSNVIYDAHAELRQKMDAVKHACHLARRDYERVGAEFNAIREMYDTLKAENDRLRKAAEIGLEYMRAHRQRISECWVRSQMDDDIRHIEEALGKDGMDNG